MMKFAIKEIYKIIDSFGWVSMRAGVKVCVIG